MRLKLWPVLMSVCMMSCSSKQDIVDFEYASSQIWAQSAHGASMPKTPENLARTRLLCRHKSVKVVLVDYDEPITY